MTEKILVVEDEPTLQETIAYNLKKQGYDVEIVGDGRAALEAARTLNPDLLLLDIMLPSLDGLEITRILRREMNVPIIMLTARDDEIDRVVGLEMGADDYLTKPFSMRELMARVKTQLRRARLHQEELARSVEKETQQETLKFGELTINTTRHEVTLRGEALSLKPKEYELLLFFAEHRGQMLSREFILERVWGWEYVGDSRTVDVHIRWLRKKVENDPSAPERIITVRGGGYRFEG
ncbi:MAG: response regulator transcription factor [Anaerolineae bacterium]|jgi:DNA-binding response OmpR family regulator|nr:response regulator transcription factor [Anaerolineae bacterium]MBT7326121.1 response regulator transcription factor [Anaerolineae bacterium]